jgi:putative transposase
LLSYLSSLTFTSTRSRFGKISFSKVPPKSSSGASGGKPPAPPVDIKALHAKIGELTLENDFFRGCAQQSGVAQRKAMIDRDHALPVSKQCAALEISQEISGGSVYYEPVAVSAGDLALMRRLDELHLDHPHAGSRMLRDLLAAEGSKIGRRHVRTLMQLMGIEAVYRRPRTSNPAPGHKVFPYLLRGITINRANQVWASDITYIPMARGFVYLAAVMDWFARRSWLGGCRSPWVWILHGGGR